MLVNSRGDACCVHAVVPARSGQRTPHSPAAVCYWHVSSTGRRLQSTHRLFTPPIPVWSVAHRSVYWFKVTTHLENLEVMENFAVYTHTHV